jgi:hypothetical protein
VTWVIWNLASFCLETVLVSVQDSCVVSAKCTMCSEIIWMHLLVPLGEEGQVEVIHDRCMVCIERTIGLEIALDAPNGTLRRRESCGIPILSLWTQCYCRCKIYAWFAPNIPSAQKSFWSHPMVHLGDEAQVKVGPFGDTANLDARQVHCLRQIYHRLRNPFGCTRWKS